MELMYGYAVFRMEGLTFFQLLDSSFFRKISHKSTIVRTSVPRFQTDKWSTWFLPYCKIREVLTMHCQIRCSIREEKTDFVNLIMFKYKGIVIKHMLCDWENTIWTCIWSRDLRKCGSITCVQTNIF